MQQTVARDKPLSLVTGAAGFIGSHVVDHLLAQGHSVIGFDSFVRGRRDLLAQALQHSDFRLYEADCSDHLQLKRLIEPHAKASQIDAVWHLAANSDIAAGSSNARLDLRDTFMTTFTVLDTMQQFGLKRIAFSSSSAIYGEHSKPVHENVGPLLPISNYGAMKLASEAIISAGLESYLDTAWIFRFPNVVGPRSTHGVIIDLLRKLERSPPTLTVLGDGKQRKPYLHVNDLIDAMWFIKTHSRERLNIYNIGPRDDGVTVKIIAEEIVRVARPGTPLEFTGGDRGWIGDVPSFSYNTDKLRSLGWSRGKTSQDAITLAIREVLKEMSER